MHELTPTQAMAHLSAYAANTEQRGHSLKLLAIGSQGGPAGKARAYTKRSLFVPGPVI